jgi:hypothetical protein
MQDNDPNIRIQKLYMREFWIYCNSKGNADHVRAIKTRDELEAFYRDWVDNHCGLRKLRGIGFSSVLFRMVGGVGFWCV